jgi:hypothetical protein
VLIELITKAKFRKIKKAFKKLIHDIQVEQASIILSKMALSTKLISKKNQVLINVI